jgi:hypothetical protein
MNLDSTAVSNINNQKRQHEKQPKQHQQAQHQNIIYFKSCGVIDFTEISGS